MLLCSRIYCKYVIFRSLQVLIAKLGGHSNTAARRFCDGPVHPYFSPGIDHHPAANAGYHATRFPPGIVRTLSTARPRARHRPPASCHPAASAARRYTPPAPYSNRGLNGEFFPICPLLRSLFSLKEVISCTPEFPMVNTSIPRTAVFP